MPKDFRRSLKQSNNTSPIVVTGAAGFIGSHLTDYLLALGHSVVAVDDLSLGFKRNLSQHKRLMFHRCDLRQSQSTARLIHKYKPKIIYHLAAWAHEGLSQFMPKQITETNYNSFLNIITPAIKSGLSKIIVCSSMSVYGAQTPPFSEEMPRRPVDIYGIAKTAMENATEVLARVYGFEYVIVRPHNVYGPRQNMSDPYRNVVAIFINRLLNNRPFYIYGDGKQKRAFTYIDDLIPYIAQTGLKRKIKNEIYNIGPRMEYTIKELAKIILREFPSKLKPIYLAKRPAEVDNAYSTSDKAIRDLGFVHKTSLISGIRQTISWAKTQGYQKPQYLTQLEIESKFLPKTWSQKLI